MTLARSCDKVARMNARSDNLPQARPRVYCYGVSWRDRRKPWIVKFKRNKRTVYIGSFATLIEAETAANQYWKPTK